MYMNFIEGQKGVDLTPKNRGSTRSVKFLSEACVLLHFLGSSQRGSSSDMPNKSVKQYERKEWQ